jgi:uncharacterized membrane protein
MLQPPQISRKQICKIFSWKNISFDLKIIYLLLGLGIIGIYLPILNENQLRIILVAPVIFFIPGYSLTAALFPNNNSIDGLERLVFSIALSIMVLPLIGLALNYTDWGIHLTPIIVSLIIFTFLMVLIAQYRRFQENEEERYKVIFSKIFEGIKEHFPPYQDPLLIRSINVIILLVLIAALCLTVYFLVIPRVGEKFTEFYILGENGKAANYPTDLLVGIPSQIIIGIGNHEYQKTNYIVEIWLMNTTFNTTTNSTFIKYMERLDQFSVSL